MNAASEGCRLGGGGEGWPNFLKVIGVNSASLYWGQPFAGSKTSPTRSLSHWISSAGRKKTEHVYHYFTVFKKPRS